MHPSVTDLTVASDVGSRDFAPTRCTTERAADEAAIPCLCGRCGLSLASLCGDTAAEVCARRVDDLIGVWQVGDVSSD
jgi:hypothetical protein